MTGSIFLASKLLETPCNPQNIINVFLTILEEPLPGLFTQAAQGHQDAMFAAESHILKNLGFRVEVKLWYSLAINYLQILDLGRHQKIPQQVWNYCNDMYGLSTEDLMQATYYASVSTHPSHFGLYCYFLDCKGLTD